MGVRDHRQSGGGTHVDGKTTAGSHADVGVLRTIRFLGSRTPYWDCSGEKVIGPTFKIKIDFACGREQSKPLMGSRDYGLLQYPNLECQIEIT